MFVKVLNLLFILLTCLLYSMSKYMHFSCVLWWPLSPVKMCESSATRTRGLIHLSNCQIHVMRHSSSKFLLQSEPLYKAYQLSYTCGPKDGISDVPIRLKMIWLSAAATVTSPYGRITAMLMREAEGSMTVSQQCCSHKPDWNIPVMTALALSPQLCFQTATNNQRILLDRHPEGPVTGLESVLTTLIS